MRKLFPYTVSAVTKDRSRAFQVIALTLFALSLFIIIICSVLMLSGQVKQISNDEQAQKMNDVPNRFTKPGFAGHARKIEK